MSTKKGSAKKTGPPKHQNKTTFKNNLHDTSKQTKQINSLEVTGVCLRCKEVVEWKIKYKKYKPLTVPKKCVRCEEKTVKKAYYIVCEPCATKLEVCAKCNKSDDTIEKAGLTPQEEARQQSMLEQEIKMMPERKRRTFLRTHEQGKLQEAAETDDGQDEDNMDEDDGLDPGNSDDKKDIDVVDGDDDGLQEDNIALSS